eukprot:Selendium_serpulae@DN9648_c0_g1_i1.p1
MNRHAGPTFRRMGSAPIGSIKRANSSPVGEARLRHAASWAGETEKQTLKTRSGVLLDPEAQAMLKAFASPRCMSSGIGTGPMSRMPSRLPSRAHQAPLRMGSTTYSFNKDQKDKSAEQESAHKCTGILHARSRAVDLERMKTTHFQQKVLNVPRRAVSTGLNNLASKKSIVNSLRQQPALTSGVE